MKILFYDARDYDKESFDAELKDYPSVKIDYVEANLTPVTASLARGYDAVCAFVNAEANAMTLEILRGFDVKLVLMRCAGFDAVNVPVAKDLGMTVTRVPAYSPEAIAEHAMGLALCANRRIHKGYIRVRENDFDLSGLVGETLHGKTAGIIGTGRIGAALCRICKGFGMHVLGSDLYPNQKLVDEEHVVDEYVDYDELYRRSDLISLHAFLNEESRHMINDESIAKMKDGVIFVNTGRGGLVDTQALIRGILSGKIGAAGLDVYDEEGANVYQNHSGEVIDSVTARLCSFPNVVMTSHQAFFTKEALSQIARVTLENAVAFDNKTDFVDRSVVC
ncbi:2-hydroxyacid dehydrogenase [Olsenella uli]|uniref:2-hydroxyacid dehydrogenase n=1 Tax=Olsenella uli TaxID=133926 RepID=UPI0012AC2AF6|nr:2-hydroxyacid dehydrogenase [Olsenella uli]